MKCLSTHESKCDGIRKLQAGEITGQENVDWVTCLICGFKCKSLGRHLKIRHAMNSRDYLKAHPGALVKCSATYARYSAQNKLSGDWIKRKKAIGEDLTSYKKKMGQAVSDSIMSNPDERARRAAQMATNNRTPEARRRSSDAAKITSARPEILAARAAKLAEWRNMHYEDFYEKCVKAMLSTWFSKPELALFEILSNVEGYKFKHNQVVKSEEFQNKSHRKQVDIADKELRVYVEFDGILHFENRFRNDEEFKQAQMRDRLLDNHIIKHGWTLIRISYDQYSYKDGGHFSEECLKKLFEILKNPTPGVHHIGKMYCSTEQ